MNKSVNLLTQDIQNCNGHKIKYTTLTLMVLIQYIKNVLNIFFSALLYLHCIFFFWDIFISLLSYISIDIWYISFVSLKFAKTSQKSYTQWIIYVLWIGIKKTWTFYITYIDKNIFIAKRYTYNVSSAKYLHYFLA